MKNLSLLALSCLILLVSSCGSSDYEFTDDQSGVSITFPEKPQKDQNSTVNGRTLRNVQFEKPDFYLSIVFDYVVQEVTDDFIALMKQSVINACETQGSELVLIEEKILDNQRSIYAEQKFNENESTKMFIVLYDDVVVTLGATALNSYDGFDAEANAFF